ncbi:coiled-coil domain-containing protein, partial [Cellulomonas shaoxiangyii]
MHDEQQRATPRTDGSAGPPAAVPPTAATRAGTRSPHRAPAWVRHRRLLGVAPVALLTFGLVASPATLAGAAPGQDDVRDARAAVGQAQRSVAQMEVRLAELAASADAAQVAVQSAGEDYAQALADADAAKVRAQEAAARSEQAGAQAEDARQRLVAVARQLARSGGSVEALEAVLSADGFQDVARRSTALNRATGKADEVVQEFTAALLVAETMQTRSTRAAADAETAAAAAEDALVTAQDAQSTADASLTAGQAERDGLIDALAAARQTSAEVERARQDALDAERRARAEASAQADRTRPAAPAAT